MRVLQVIQQRHGGGAERVVDGLVRALGLAGHDVAIAAAGSEATFPIPLIGRRPWRLPFVARALKRVVTSWKPDIVHAHNPAIGLATALALRGSPRAALLTMHGVPDEDYDRAARLLARSGLPVVACGPGVEAALREHGLSPIRTIMNGIPPSPAPMPRRALVDLWSVPQHHRVVGVVGRLHPVKNQELALAALTLLPDVTMLLVGEGPARPRLESETDRLGLSDRVIFTGYREDAVSVMGAIDVLILPSRSEGLPLAALEAMGMGTPVVATDVQGFRGLVEDGDSALLVEPRPQALAAAVTRVFDNSDLRQRLIGGGARVVAGCDESSMTRSYIELYEALRAG